MAGWLPGYSATARAADLQARANSANRAAASGESCGGEGSGVVINASGATGTVQPSGAASAQVGGCTSDHVTRGARSRAETASPRTFWLWRSLVILIYSGRT